MNPWKTLLPALAACLWISTAWAGSSWLDKGSELLNSVNESSSSSTSSSSGLLGAGLSTDEVISALKQALEKGSAAVVAQVGAQDGFNADDLIHIPLPDSLSTVQSLLEKAGLGSYADTVELKLNRAAEAAAPEAKTLFLDAISSMEIADAKNILNGADDAATQYFKEKMSPGLVKAMTPVVDETLDSVGAIQAYDAMISEYKTLPFVPDVKSDLSAYTVEKAMEGIFYYLAQEEKAIRENPAARTTALLQKVFGN